MDHRARSVAGIDIINLLPLIANTDGCNLLKARNGRRRTQGYWGNTDSG